MAFHYGKSPWLRTHMRSQLRAFLFFLPKQMISRTNMACRRKGTGLSFVNARKCLLVKQDFAEKPLDNIGRRYL